MAHKEQLEFCDIIKYFNLENFSKAKVLEVGSLDINGSVRYLFDNCDYTGVDVSVGKGVDLVCQGQLLEYPTCFFDTVISCEAMEHNPFWVETMSNMFRMCKEGGLVIMTCASPGRIEHGTTRSTPENSPLTVDLDWNYYRNLSERDFLSVFPLELWFSEFQILRNWHSCDLLFWGRKRLDSEINSSDSDLKFKLDERYLHKNDFKTIKRKIQVGLLNDEQLFILRKALTKKWFLS